MLDIILTAVLLSSPSSQCEAAWVTVLRPSVLAVAINAELIDPRERDHVDIDLIRSRQDELANAPIILEGQRFPDRKLINELLALNRSCRNYLTARMEIDSIHIEELRDAICETDQLYNVWDNLRDAQCDYYYVSVRRQALRTLRTLIGDEAFYTGQMPPHVPVWHFPRSSPRMP